MIRAALIVALFAGVVRASAQGADNAFDAASVKTSTSNSGPLVPGIFLPDGRWSAQRATLAMLLRSAYSLTFDRILGMPAWAHTERFDIVTTSSPDTPIERSRGMAQRLLIDRFGLRAHWEQRGGDVYALVLADPSRRLGPGLRPSGAPCQRSDPVSGEPLEPPRTGPCVETFRRLDDGAYQLRFRDRPLTDLLIIAGARDEVGGQVADQTGLTDRFDIDLDYVPRSARGLGAVGLGVPLAAAVVDQLGLRFERRRESIDVLVIDSVERPTPD
jgi:uncharacterized protein (TIGR03435 family)